MRRDERVRDFEARADAWLDANASCAPQDYGAIVPPDVVDEAKAWQRRLSDAGFAGIAWPRVHGGQGLTAEHAAAWSAACARHEVPQFLNMVGHVLAANALLVHGTDEQKSAHLPGTARGELVWCQLFSEPGAGSDLASLSTVAVRGRSPRASGASACSDCRGEGAGRGRSPAGRASASEPAGDGVRGRRPPSERGERLLGLPR